MASLLLSDPRDIDGALAKAKALEGLHGIGGSGLMRQFCEADGLFVNAADYFPATPTCPRWAVVATPGATIFFIGGIETLVQGQGIWNAYLGGYANVFTSQPQNSWFQNAAQQIYDTAVGQYRSNVPVFIGYSAGGAIAYHSRKKFFDATGSPSSAVCTLFGAPKARARDVTPLGNQSTLVCWNNVDDAVVNVPPQLSQWERFVAGFSVFQLTRLNNYFWYQEYRAIGLTGTVETSGGNFFQGVPDSVSVGAWLNQAVNGIENPHSIHVYVARLTLAAALYTPQNQPMDGIGGGEDEPPELTPGVGRSAQAVSVQTIFADASRQNQQPAVIPVAQQFNWRRSGRIYYVTFGGTDIAIAPKKKRAKALARVGNDWLRRLQTEAVVAPEAIVQQFETYVNAATDPAGGFTPLLNTTP